jgi:tetratricopeptide (TPR) repeat protein
MTAMLGVLPLGEDQQKFSRLGKNVLFDGSSHTYATDAEEHLLNLVKENPQDAFLWNRLGNLYRRGNRPDLAVCVLEHSILIDPGQIESHFTLGDLLFQIDALEEAGQHLRQTLLHAGSYKKIPADQLRDMLANALKMLFMISGETGGDVPFLPTSEEISSFGEKVDEEKFGIMELEIYPDRLESFYPLAEMFMGDRAKEILMRDRTFTGTTGMKKTYKPIKKKVRKKKARK